ncbi:cuticle protein 16.5-like [Schistocerca cancellata]|uniref:cuticle protein 16.5-like n=1 Tax=Schistocerca cancellata TaxID=274614 RepID=UPI0021190C2C|nr:cuticle protein 16.5-like [Schistocerca cancellata]
MRPLLDVTLSALHLCCCVAIVCRKAHGWPPPSRLYIRRLGTRAAVCLCSSSNNMIKIALVLALAACCVSAAPKAGLAPLAYSAPLVAAAPVSYAAPAPAVVTAHSSQYIAQNFNGLAVAAAAPVVAAAPAVAAAYHAAPVIFV